MAEASRFFYVTSFEQDGTPGRDIIVYTDPGQDRLSDTIRRTVFAELPDTVDYYLSELPRRESRKCEKTLRDADFARRLYESLHTVLGYYSLAAQRDQTAEI